MTCVISNTNSVFGELYIESHYSHIYAAYTLTHIHTHTFNSLTFHTLRHEEEMGSRGGRLYELRLVKHATVKTFPPGSY